MTGKEISVTPGQLKPTDVSSPYLAERSETPSPQALHTLGTTKLPRSRPSSDTARREPYILPPTLTACGPFVVN